jgi:hypothetical protein
MLEIVDRNGNINNMPALEGDVVSNVALTTMGGKLMETTMQLGTTDADATSLPFYVTLGAVNSDFVDIRNLYEDKLSDLVSFVCEDGTASVVLDLPEKLYEAFLAALLITENITLDDMNVVNGEISANFINDMFIPLFKSDITVKTFDNTLAKFGVDLDLASTKGAEALFAKLKDFYTTATFTYDEIGVATNGNLPISSIIDSMNVGVLGNIIAEKDTGINLNVRLAVKDLAKDYEAIYLDTDAAGIVNKVGLTQDLDKKLAEVEGACGIILLKDVDADLTFNTTTVFNLNGFKVNGDINAKAKTVIIDSNIKSSKIGYVTGDVTGEAIIVAGKYDADVTALIKKGFVQGDDGVVTNQYYDMTQTAEGDIIVSLSADFISATEMPDMTALAIDIACDILFNGYSNNYLELDGNLIYSLTFEDLVGLYTSSDRLDTVIEEGLKMVDTAQLSTFINTLLDDLADFTAISEAIKNNEPVLEYQMVTKPWAAEFVHVTADDSITTGIVSGDKVDDVKLKLTVSGSDENKAYIADIFEEFGKTIDADVNLNLSHGKDGKEIYLNASADAEVIIDWTNPNYAVMFGVIMADGPTPAERADLVSAIRTYYETGDNTALKKAYNALTIQQVIKSVENFNRGDDFNAMVKNLGLNDVVIAEVAELEKLYDEIGKVFAFLVRKADLDRGSRTLGSLLDADGSYGVTRANLEKLIKASLFRGYTGEVELAITSAVLKIKLFEDNTIAPPEFVDDHGNPAFTIGNKIVGAKVNTTEKILFVDTQIEGLTVSQFKKLLKLEAINADTIDVEIAGLSNSDLVANGSKLTATARREGTDEIDVVNYEIIVLGDTNCNGRIDVGDASLISRELVDDYNFNRIQTLAADTNCNDRTDIGDATRIATKIVDWDNYETMLGIENV